MKRPPNRKITAEEIDNDHRIIARLAQGKMDHPTLDSVIKDAQKLSEKLCSVPVCSRQTSKEGSCISREGDRPLEPFEMKSGATIRAIYMYNHNNMCSACAAYWFVTMAEIKLRHVKKMEKIR